MNRKHFMMATAAAAGLSSVGFGALIGLSIDFPFLFYSTTLPTATSYDATSDVFSVKFQAPFRL